jgi:acyl phosphate:glycerol-3-phosphate acyltransferase
MTATQLAVVLGCLAAAYLLGAVPFAFVVARSRGVDIRKVGSGNVGATNVSRVLGRRLGILTFVLDVLKGFAPMMLAPHAWSLVGYSPAAGVSDTLFYTTWIAVAAAAIAGHMFPVYLGFKGGKGVATSLGVLLGLWPYYTVPGLICFAVWIVVFLATRYVSVGSIVAAALFPALYAAIGAWRDWQPWARQRPLLLFSLVMAFLVVYRHRANIRRLLAGQEHRFGTGVPGETGQKPA